MALYVVLHHRSDPHQPWKNLWDGDDRVVVIETTSQIANLAKDARRVFVHRCAYAGAPAALVCEAEVLRAGADGKKGWVEFKTIRTLNAKPPLAPLRGQSFYEAPEPA